MMESQDGGDAEKKVLPKGKGLKKWRRIQRRERDAAAAAAAKDAFVEDDVHRFVKREARRVVRRSGSTSPSNTSSRSSTAASAPKFPPPVEPTKKARASGVSTKSIDTSIFTINGHGGVPHFTFGDQHSKQQQQQQQQQDDAAQRLLADSLLSLQALHQALQHGTLPSSLSNFILKGHVLNAKEIPLILDSLVKPVMYDAPNVLHYIYRMCNHFLEFLVTVIVEDVFMNFSD